MTRAVLVAVAGALLMGACGGGRPSHEEFVRNVSALCNAADERRGQVAEGFDFQAFDPDTSDLSTIVPVIEGNVAIGRETDRELAKVRGPKADERRLRNVLEIGRQRHALGDEEAAAARKGDRAAFKELIAREDAISAPQEEPFASC